MVKIYIKDNANGGAVREYGTDRHDSLVLQEDGSLHYLNLQNGEGTGGDYQFCMSDGSIPSHEDQDILDVGGERTSVGCEWCRWRNRHQKCTCCRRNPYHKDCYETDKQAVAEMEKKLFGSIQETEDKNNDESFL